MSTSTTLGYRRMLGNWSSRAKRFWVQTQSVRSLTLWGVLEEDGLTCIYIPAPRPHSPGFSVRGVGCKCVADEKLTVFPVVVSPATTSPLSSLFSLLRSVVVAALLYGFCLGAINVSARTVALLPCLSLSNYLAVSPHLSRSLVLPRRERGMNASWGPIHHQLFSSLCGWQ